MTNPIEKVIKINDVIHFLEVKLPASSSLEVWRNLNDNKWDKAVVILEREKSKSTNQPIVEGIEDCITFFGGMGK